MPVENPWPSNLFHTTAINKQLQLLGMITVKYDCCAWGACYRKCSQLRTNMAELSKLGKHCRNAPPHKHDVLEGIVTIMRDGKLENVWKTSLAGAYVPVLCRAWAQTLKHHAPPGAHVRPGESALNNQWQIWLMDMSGHTGYCLTPVPTCPAEFSAAWDGALKMWSHATSTMRKKPAAAPPAPGSLRRKRPPSESRASACGR